MFDKLKKMFQHEIVIGAPVEGKVVPIQEVNDPTFSQEIVGKGIAIHPEKGRVVAPVDGSISFMIDSGHAVSLLSKDGVEILIHIGLDTVKLKGQHFTVHVKTGDQVSAGDLLIEFDKEAIQAAGYEVITPMVICNHSDFSKFETFPNQSVHELDKVIQLSK